LGAFIGITLASWLVGDASDPSYNSFNIGSVLFSAFVAVVASIIFSAYIRHRESMLKLKLAASEESRRADNARHAMLQAQLEPHMLFNTLANLRALIQTDTDKAVVMLDRFDSFLRETLSSSKMRHHSLEHEFSVLDDYLALMKVRFGDRLQYTLNLDHGCKDRLVPSLLLQPLVENAIKYGVEPQVDGAQIIVSAKGGAETTMVSVYDSGGGFDVTTIDRSDKLSQDASSLNGGFGLNNIKERLVHSFGNRATFEMESNAASGTTVTLTLPLISTEPTL